MTFDEAFFEALCLRHAVPEADVARALPQPQLGEARRGVRGRPELSANLRAHAEGPSTQALRGLGCPALTDAEARAVRVCYARTEPLFDLDAFRRLLADGRKKKPASAASERPPPLSVVALRRRRLEAAAI